jgi:HAD superfamily hydrolase (TIGR01509 family)
MDGTLVDTEPYWIAREHEIVAEFGNGLWNEEHGRQLVGRDLRDSARYMIEHGELPLAVDHVVNLLLDGVIDRLRTRIPWQPGAPELLAELRRAGVPCALVTMSWRRFADAVVHALPRGTFDAVVTGDEVTHGKPHPEPYLRAAALLGVDPHQCVAIEDSPTGIQSAMAAGCVTVGVPHIVPLVPQPGLRIEPTLLGMMPELLLAPQPALPAQAAPHTAPAGSRQAAVHTPPAPPARAARNRRPWLVAATAVAVLGAAGGATVRLADDSPPPPPDIPIDAWAPYWNLDRSRPALDSYGYLLREVSPFWFETRGATSIVLDENVPADIAAAFVAEARRQRIPVLPAVTDGMPRGGLAAVLADPASRAAHVQALVDFARFGDFDGIDLDYEGFAFVDSRETWDEIRPNWVLFVDQLGRALHADGRLLSVTVPPPQNYAVYAIEQLEAHVDRIRIMAYDYSTAEPGPIAPLSYVRDTIDTAKRLIGDDSKIVLGVPLYGYNWVVGTTGVCPADAPGQREAVAQHQVDELLAKRGAAAVFDATTGESSFSYELELTDGVTTCVQSRQVHYVDAEGARLRIDMARRSFLGGAALWALGFDDGATWTAIGSLGRVDDPASGGSTTVAPSSTVGG